MWRGRTHAAQHRNGDAPTWFSTERQSELCRNVAFSPFEGGIAGYCQWQLNAASLEPRSLHSCSSG
jgi:hypothetical protein